MLKFYISRLEAHRQEERQEYLDTVVVNTFRDAVREEWNKLHPDEPLD